MSEMWTPFLSESYDSLESVRHMLQDGHDFYKPKKPFCTECTGNISQELSEKLQDRILVHINFKTLEKNAAERAAKAFTLVAPESPKSRSLNTCDGHCKCRRQSLSSPVRKAPRPSSPNGMQSDPVPEVTNNTGGKNSGTFRVFYLPLPDFFNDIRLVEGTLNESEMEMYFDYNKAYIGFLPLLLTPETTTPDALFGPLAACFSIDGSQQNNISQRNTPDSGWIYKQIVNAFQGDENSGQPLGLSRPPIVINVNPYFVNAPFPTEGLSNNVMHINIVPKSDYYVYLDKSHWVGTNLDQVIYQALTRAPYYPVQVIVTYERTNSSESVIIFNSAVVKNMTQEEFMQRQEPNVAQPPPEVQVNIPTPPVSSNGIEAEDDFNMRLNHEGAIPLGMGNPAYLNQSGSGPGTSTSTVSCNCRLSLCQNFAAFIETTPENVKDKVSIIKEIIHHVNYKLNAAIPSFPEAMRENVQNVSMSVKMIGSSLERETDMESFKRIVPVVQLVLQHVIQDLQKLM